MNHLIAELIHDSKGYSYETAGAVLVFFNDPQQARRCAQAITLATDKTVDICGCRLSIV